MPKLVEIGPVEFSADEEQNMRAQAQRARETAAARLQGRAPESSMTKYLTPEDGSKTLVSRKAARSRPISREEF